MFVEIESKFFGVDLAEVERRARALGVEVSELVQENYVVAGNGWLMRVREEGKRLIWTMKRGVHAKDGIKIADEVEFGINGRLEDALEVLKTVAEETGAERGKYVKRIKRFEVAGAHVELVRLEGLEYAEIEGDKRSIKEACSLLGIDYEKRSGKSVGDLIALQSW